MHDIGLSLGNYPSTVEIVDNKAITVNLIKGMLEGIQTYLEKGNHPFFKSLFSHTHILLFLSIIDFVESQSLR